MTTNNPLSERITRYYAELTESYRRIADYLQLNPDKVLMMSTAEIAEDCGVSKTSVSRFIRKLGYEDHTELRQELLGEREKGQPVITSMLQNTELSHEVKALEQLWSQLSGENIRALIEKLSTARRIKVIGYRNSYPLAMHFRQQLMQCRDGVDLLPLPGQTIGEDLASITEDDFVVVIGIRRRVANFPQMMDFLSRFSCLLITDQSGQQYASQAEFFFVCHLNNTLPLDSYAAPMTLIAYLVNQTFIYLKGQASHMSSQISVNYVQLSELE
jgi:DNA-binding MurR/RpiR family transcriptional regulator